jgi:hypothetical protein
VTVQQRCDWLAFEAAAGATMFYLRKVSKSANFNYLFQESGVPYTKARYYEYKLSFPATT